MSKVKKSLSELFNRKPFLEKIIGKPEPYLPIKEEMEQKAVQELQKDEDRRFFDALEKIAISPKASYISPAYEDIEGNIIAKKPTYAKWVGDLHFSYPIRNPLEVGDPVDTPAGPGYVWEIDEAGIICVELESEPDYIHEFKAEEVNKSKTKTKRPAPKKEDHRTQHQKWVDQMRQTDEWGHPIKSADEHSWYSIPTGQIGHTQSRIVKSAQPGISELGGFIPAALKDIAPVTTYSPEVQEDWKAWGAYCEEKEFVKQKGNRKCPECSRSMGDWVGPVCSICQWRRYDDGSIQ